MTRIQVEQFVQAVNRALPAGMELCIEVVDLRKRVVHLRMDRVEGIPSQIQLTMETMAALAENAGAAAVYLTKVGG